jgi:hypothetical protein
MSKMPTSSTLNGAFFIALALLAHQLGFGQSVTLSIGSGSAQNGGAVAIPITLISQSESKTAGLEWTFKYSSDISKVTVTPTESATRAGNSISCFVNKCLIFGSTKNSVGNGTVAIATFHIAPNPSKEEIRVEVVNVIAATGSGASIPASGSVGTISLRKHSLLTHQEETSPQAHLNDPR